MNFYRITYMDKPGFPHVRNINAESDTAAIINATASLPPYSTVIQIERLTVIYQAELEDLKGD